jgi:hypothetical protein
VKVIKRYVGMGTFVLLIEALLLLRVMPPGFNGWKSVTVGPGQTLWELGEMYCPNTDPRYVVGAIETRNHIDANIQPGDVLWVPTKSVSVWARLVF